jgi:hypothetical protein
MFRAVENGVGLKRLSRRAPPSQVITKAGQGSRSNSNPAPVGGSLRGRRSCLGDELMNTRAGSHRRRDTSPAGQPLLGHRSVAARLTPAARRGRTCLRMRDWHPVAEGEEPDALVRS